MTTALLATLAALSIFCLGLVAYDFIRVEIRLREQREEAAREEAEMIESIRAARRWEESRRG
ncbi:MAG TPA: hypothetical protein VD965_11510 [Burkholderiales bacterium]|nr:hypothetical protein [Burkholderiales bacterium]